MQGEDESVGKGKKTRCRASPARLRPPVPGDSEMATDPSRLSVALVMELTLATTMYPRKAHARMTVTQSTELREIVFRAIDTSTFIYNSAGEREKER